MIATLKIVVLLFTIVFMNLVVSIQLSLIILHRSTPFFDTIHASFRSLKIAIICDI